LNNIEYIFEGHDLTKEVVMVQVRDNPDAPWSGPKRLGVICTKSNYPFVIFDGVGGPQSYKYVRLATPTIKPWTLKTAPRHIEVELEKGVFCVATIKTSGSVTFLKDGNIHIRTWDELTQYKQWDGTPCGEVVE
jgi:hypothetical protein